MNVTENLKITELIENTIQQLKNACGTTRAWASRLNVLSETDFFNVKWKHSEIAINQYNVTSMCVYVISTFTRLTVTVKLK